MTAPLIVPRSSARSRLHAGVLVARLSQRRNSDQQARRRQLLEHGPEAFAAQLTRRAEDLQRKIAEARQ